MEHLQGALDWLEQQSGVLGLNCNTLRQEEITEEIEVILVGGEALYQPTLASQVGGDWHRGCASPA